MAVSSLINPDMTATNCEGNNSTDKVLYVCVPPSDSNSKIEMCPDIPR